MTSVLEEVAEAADDIARDQHLVATRARQLQRQRDRGWSWAKIFQREPQPGLLALLARSARRLAEAAGRFRRLLAAELSEEGWSRRTIAGLFGVTHQRVSAMLGRRPSAPVSDQDR